ncbi:MAG: VWA domain-containing protein [Elusimicrobia bacterium]|nr:VWA domain-containing protein [Elusimicrobiota bacterium]
MRSRLPLACLLAFGTAPAGASAGGESVRGRIRAVQKDLGAVGAGGLDAAFDARPATPAPAPAAPAGPGAADPLERFLAERQVPPERWPGVRRRLDELWRLLSAVGVALGDRKALEFRVGDWWMTDTEEGVVFLPLREILDNLDKPEVLIGGVSHEAGHVYWTRFSELPAYEKMIEEERFPKAVHILFNVAEDLFEERVMGAFWPGLPFYLRKLHGHYRSDLLPSDLAGPGAGEAREPREPLPHELYLEFIRAYWTSGSFPALESIEKPEVRAAAAATQASIERLARELPKRRAVTEERKLQDAERRFEQIRRELLPDYRRLLAMSEEQLKREERDGQSGSGEGQGGDGDGRAEIERRARELARRYFPTHGDEDELARRRRERRQRQDRQDSVPLDPSRRQDSGGRDGEDGQDGQAPRDGAPAPAQGGAEPGDPLSKEEEALRRHQEARDAASPVGGYEENLLAVAPLIDAFWGRLEQLFAKNFRPAWEGYFDSGQRPNIKRWMRSESRGWTHPDDFKVFEKRREPARRDYKFRLLLDLSGSMTGMKKVLALRTAILFMEVLERLSIDYSILGFNDRVFLFKDFEPHGNEARKLPPDAKRELLADIEKTPTGMTKDTEAVIASLAGTDLPDGRRVQGLERQPGEGRYLIVLTDGEGNGAASGELEQAVAKAAAQGVLVIGVGIGDGIRYVQQRYPSHVVEPRVENLPDRVGDLLQRVIREGLEQGLPDRSNAGKP